MKTEAITYYICEVCCGRYKSESEASKCEESCRSKKEAEKVAWEKAVPGLKVAVAGLALRSGKIKLGDSKDIKKPADVIPDGYSYWIENGTYYAAPIVPADKFGLHAYYIGSAYDNGVRDCPCGCRMYDSSSSGPVDPFGRCPMNPIARH